MRIKKVSQTTPVQAHLTNAYSESTQDGYSADYINGLHEYSTTEQRVGTWIDGKPIYRKTWVDTMPVVTTNETFVEKEIDPSINFGTVTKIEGSFYAGSNSQYVMNFPTMIGKLGAYVYILDGKIKISSSAQFYNNKVCYVTLEYTKTTD